MSSSLIRISRTHIDGFTLNNSDPTWRFALGGGGPNATVLVEVHAESGNIGRGVAAGLAHIGYPLESVQQKVPDLLRVVEDAGVVDAGALSPLLRELIEVGASCPPALAAVEMAVYDLVGRELGQPVYRLLGGAFRRSSTVLRILSLKEPEEVAANAKRLVDSGIRALKIKLDNQTIDTDVDRIIAVREVVGPDVQLTLDANQSHSAQSAIEVCERTAHCNIDLFEQPVPADDLAGLREVKQSPKVTPAVEADEACSSVERAMELLCMEAVDSISLKLPKLGGITIAREVATLCQVAGVSCRFGAHVGSRMLNAVAVHSMASIPNISFASELGEFDRLLGDPFTGFEVADGQVFLSDEPGFGVDYSPTS